MGTGTIRLRRVAEFRDRLRAYKVVLDGQVIGQIRHGEEAEFAVEPGPHELYLKIDWCRSNTVEFENDGPVTVFECGSNLKGPAIFLAILYVTLWRERYLWLRRDSGAAFSEGLLTREN